MPVEGARKGFCHSVGAGVQAGHQLQCSAQGWDGGPRGPGGASGRSPAAETHSQTQGLLLKSQRPGRQVRGRSGIALLLGFCSSFNPTGCDDKEGDGLLMGAPCMQHGRRAPLLAQLLRVGRGAPSAPSRASGALEPLAVLGGPHPQLPGHCPVCRASDQFRPFSAPHLVWRGSVVVVPLQPPLSSFAFVSACGFWGQGGPRGNQLPRAGRAACQAALQQPGKLCAGFAQQGSSGAAEEELCPHSLLSPLKCSMPLPPYLYTWEQRGEGSGAGLRLDA